MKCISLWQPWASLLVHGAKRCETRSWFLYHRGPLLIHAGKKWDRELRAICQEEPFRTVLERESFGASVNCGSPPLGALVGVVNVVDCVPTEKVICDGVEAPWQWSDRGLLIGPTEFAFGDFSPGRYAILCQQAQPFADPIEYRGAQGLFDVPDEVVWKEIERAAA